MWSPSIIAAQLFVYFPNFKLKFYGGERSGNDVNSDWMVQNPLKTKGRQFAAR
jgi:hypothetical protein